MGKSQMSMIEPIKLSTAFLVFFPNHLFLPECGWVSYYMEWEEYGKKFELGRELIFEKCVLTFLARKIPKNVCHSAMHPCFPFSSPLSFTLGLLGAAGVFPGCFHSMFLVVGFIFPWMGGHFCNTKDWVCFPHIFGAAGAFSTHVFTVSCVFTMAVKCFC